MNDLLVRQLHFGCHSLSFIRFGISNKTKIGSQVTW
jgi:hypothetical protein